MPNISVHSKGPSRASSEEEFAGSGSCWNDDLYNVAGFIRGRDFYFILFFLPGGKTERPGNRLTIPGIKVRLCANPGLGFGKLH